jgi:hypothetical protein
VRIVFYKNNKVINIEQVVGELIIDGNDISWTDKKIGGVNSPYLLLEDDTLTISVGDTLSDVMIAELNSQTLNRAKENKKEELNTKCEESILSGFISTNGHHYRTNRDDQTNMIGQKDELAEDLTITEVYWKAEELGYWISHTRDGWLNQVYGESFKHKKAQLTKCNDLKVKVDACLTVEDVELIVW